MQPYLNKMPADRRSLLSLQRLQQQLCPTRLRHLRSLCSVRLKHRNATRRGFEAAAKYAGNEDVSFHSMRHAFASRMIDRGISSTVLAALMGQESSAITERRYIHLFDRQRTDDAVRQAMSSAIG